MISVYLLLDLPKIRDVIHRKLEIFLALSEIFLALSVNESPM